MFKRIISLGLCLVMVAVLFAGCGQETTTTTTTNADDLPATINLIGITDSATTDASVKLVEEALNKLTKTRYKTKINLTLVTADEYIAEIEERVAQAEHAAVKVQAITKYNTLAQKEANNAQKLNSTSGKKNNKWTSQVATVVASTMSTGVVYTAEETTVYEDGRIETVYPDAQSPIDIVMIEGKEMYDYLNDKGYLLSVEKKLDEKFTKFKQYIYPTYFSQLKAITGDINAIPNNNLLAGYTYLVVDTAIAEEYDSSYNIDDVNTYADLEGLLEYVKTNHPELAPLATTPEALGIAKYMNGDVAIGTYFDPIYGYSTLEGTDFEIKNLLDIEQYQDHVALMKEYTDKGYIVNNATDFAVNVVVGDAAVAAEYIANGYEVKVLQNPFVQPEKIFEGMFAVSSYTSSEDRALEIIEMFTTDPEAKNIFQYGICDDGDNTNTANYKLVEVEGGKFKVETIENAGYVYKMKNHLTGNVYMGYPEAGVVFDEDAWDYYKQTNLDSEISPFLHLYVEEDDLDDILDAVMRRTAISRALKASGVDVSYDDYVKETTNASPKGDTYVKAIRYQYRKEFSVALSKSATSFNKLNMIINENATDQANAFVDFVLSKDGQEILAAAGYKDANPFAAPYVADTELKKGTVTLMAHTGSVRTYIELALNGLIAKFNEFYPDVKVEMPTASGAQGYVVYDPDPSNNKPNDIIEAVSGKAAIVCFESVKSDYSYENQFGERWTLVELQCASDYTSYLENTSVSAPYKQSWFEDVLIDQLQQEETYSKLVSASELAIMIQNKVASLGGATNQRVEGVVTPNSERLTLAAAKNSAKNYFTNIKYLRVMAAETFWKDVDRTQYDAMSDVDFEAAVLNYIKETNASLTEEEYTKRVQDFMVSVLEYTSEEDSTVKYYVTWDEFVAARNGSESYTEAVSALIEQYDSSLRQELLQGLLDRMTLSEKMEYVYGYMLDEYLVENGLDKEEFEAAVQNKYLEAVGTNASDFSAYSKTSDEYKNYVAKLRKKFKNILVETYSATAYKNGEKGISNEQVLDALYEYYLEEETGIYSKVAESAGMGVEEFRTAETHYANFAKYVKTMKTKYVYTLRAAGYKSDDFDKWVNGWDPYNAADTIYNVLAETGYYTNEMARYIGQDLSNYMLAKSQAVEYQNYLKNIADALATELAEGGYDKDNLIEGNGDELEAIAREIVAKKYFGDKKGVSDVLMEITAAYRNKDYTDIEEMKADAAALADDTFFMAVVQELQAMWVQIKEESAK